MKFHEAAIEVLKDSNCPLSSSEIWNKIKEKNITINTNGKTPQLSLSKILLYCSDNSKTKLHNKQIRFTIISENPNKFYLIDKIKNDKKDENSQLIDLDNDIIVDSEIVPIYECVLDDYETVLKIYNDNDTLSYKTEKCDSFTYFFPDTTKAQLKIGKTGNISNRFNQLKTANPDIHIELVLTKDTYEKNLHDKFEKYNHKLEWYFYSKEIQQFVDYEKKRRRMAIECYEKYLESIELENKFIELF